MFLTAIPNYVFELPGFAFPSIRFASYRRGDRKQTEQYQVTFDASGTAFFRTPQSIITWKNGNSSEAGIVGPHIPFRSLYLHNTSGVDCRFDFRLAVTYRWYTKL